MNSAEAYNNPQSHRRLTRSPHGMIAGVCAGLSECFGINLIFTRVVFIVLGLAQGIGVALYLILMIVIPANPQPEAAGSVATCPGQNQRKTLFAYLAGGLSILVGVLTFLNNASSAFELIRELVSSINGNRVSAVSFEPRSLPIDATVSDPVPSVAPEIIGIEGSARVVWNAGGVAYQADLQMSGQLGAASVVFRDPQSLGDVTVHERLSLEHANQDLFLIGTGPSRVDYSPDVFHVSMDRDGYLSVIESCDRLYGCNPVHSSHGRLQFVYN